MKRLIKISAATSIVFFGIIALAASAGELFDGKIRINHGGVIIGVFVLITLIDVAAALRRSLVATSISLIIWSCLFVCVGRAMVMERDNLGTAVFLAVIPIFACWKIATDIAVYVAAYRKRGTGSNNSMQATPNGAPDG